MHDASTAGNMKNKIYHTIGTIIQNQISKSWKMVNSKPMTANFPRLVQRNIEQ